MTDPALFEELRASPSLIWVVAAICLHIMNVFLGLVLAFQKKTPPLVRTHLMLYLCVMFCVGYYLVLNHFHTGNSILDYLVGAYFITLIPLSRKWDVILHASISVMGLILLPMLILLQMI